MITLYSYGRGPGIPDYSPFVTKTELYLKLAKLPYKLDSNGFNKAPKGKLPYINDEGKIVADSTFIRDYVDQKYGIDLDQELSAEQRATAWAFEKMCEDHLYWPVLDIRWLIEENFNRGPAVFFKSIPAPMRFFITKMIRSQIQKRLVGHGMGKHSREERAALADRDLKAMSDYLGTKKYFMGDKPTSVDATIFSFFTNAHCPHFKSEIGNCAKKYKNLINHYI